MAKIELLHDYFIDASARGYVLKRRRPGKTRDGQEVMREKKIGYYDNLTAALDSFCQMNQDSEFGDLHTYFADYAYRVERSNRETVEAMKKLMERGGGDLSGPRTV